MDEASLYSLFKAHPVVTTDSRNCPEGSLFFALRGERFDGNDYARAALEHGCARAIVDRRELAGEEGMVYVPDALRALQLLARAHRRALGLPVVAITGTNGKTTTKELCAAVLGRRHRVLATQGNLNNAIGVPLTLLRLTREHELAVIEMGASHPGDIKELVEIAEPDCGLITNVGRAHLEGFGSPEGVLRTKGELYDYLRARKGLVFLHEDDKRLAALCQGLRTVPYGRRQVADVCADPLLRFTLDGRTVQTQLIGAYNLSNALAAAAVGRHFGVPIDDVCAALAGYRPTNNRSQLVRTKANTLIMDAYNANPTSMAAAIDNFARLPEGDKLCILGDMKELGPASTEEHQRIVDLLAGQEGMAAWLVGEEFARANAPAHFRHFAHAQDVQDELVRHPLAGRTVLVKGSHSMQLHTLSTYL